MTSNLEELSKLIGVSDQVASNKLANLSKDSINSGAEMFLSLNLCPPDFVKLYARAISGPESMTALLTSNRIKKERDDLKIKAIKIFAKISTLLGFKHISYNHEGNGSFEKNIDVKGEIKGNLQKKENMEFSIIGGSAMTIP